MTLQPATRKESVTIITASPGAYSPFGGTRRGVNANDQVRSLNAAELLGGAPGASLRDSGAVAGVPILHGLDDDHG